jgi:diguanylate cyclase (GGDEF)-like protein
LVEGNPRKGTSLQHRMYFEVHDDGPTGRAQCHDLLDLHRRYLAACVGGTFPDESAFNIAGLPQYRAFLMRLEPLGDGSYFYAYYGSGISAVASFDMTGRSTADFEGPVRDFFEDVYARSKAAGRCLFTIHRAIKAHLVHTWERLVMPVRAANGDVVFIVYNRPREFEQDFLHAIMTELPDGIIAMRALRQAEGLIFSAQVVAANPAAATLLGMQGNQLEGDDVRGMLDGFGAGHLWPTVQEVIETRETQIREICLDQNGQRRHLRFQVTPLFDGALMHLSDITALRLATIVLEREQQQLRAEISRQRSEGDVLRGLAHSDSLTGALNRRGLFAAADEWRRTRAVKSAVIVDIDQFKAINDRHGHGTGDLVIQHVAAILFDVVSEADGFVGRLGGDEFVCILPVTTEETLAAMQSARVRIELSPVAGALGPVLLSCSLGVAPWDPDKSLDDALILADTALYAAKAAGRNRVELYDGSTAQPPAISMSSSRRRGARS